MNKAFNITLDNGLVAGFIPHRDVKSVVIQLRGFAGSNFERKNEYGAAHLTEHLSLESGEKNKILEKGGKIFGVTSRDDVLFMVKILKNEFSLALEYLYKVFTNYSFQQDFFEKQQSVVKEEIKRFENIPEKLIGRLSYKVLYPNQRISEFNTGSLKSVKKINLSKIQQFKSRYYIPNNFVLTISGDLDKRLVLNTCKTIFGVLKSDKKISLEPLKENNSFGMGYVLKDYFSQSHVKISFYGKSLVDKQMYSLMVLSKIFDNFLKSKIKSMKGFSYNVGCDSYSSYSYGTFSFYFASNNLHLKEISEDIADLIRNGDTVIKDEIIRSAKIQIISDMVYSFDKTSFRAEYYSTKFLLGDLKNNFENELKEIKSVTKSELLKALHFLKKQKPKITVLSNKDYESDLRKSFRI